MHLNETREINLNYSYDLGNTVFFDIETTGFSRAACTIYLIGAMTIEKNKADIHLFFAQNPGEENEVILQFFEYLSSAGAKKLITFNGASFDIPFVEARMSKLGINGLSFSEYEHLDIYREIAPFKSLLGLEKMGQKSIEGFLNIGREDEMDGGQLISVYKRYCKHPTNEDMHLLVIHNFEDVLGMGYLLPILSYKDIFYKKKKSPQAESSNYIIEKYEVMDYEACDGVASCQELIVTVELLSPVPVPVNYKNETYGYYLKISDNKLKIRIPIFDSFLRYYYPDYKNYWYLPSEQIAIHKSVATFADKSNRIPATPATCFTKIALSDEFLSSEKFKSYIAHCLETILT